MTMDLEPRTRAPSHATGTVEFVPIAEIAEDATFRLRDEGDVSALAASIGRLGQLVPVELRPLPGAAAGGPRWQIVSGFRRVAAIRMLLRDRVLARIHPELADEDGWGIALVEALLREPLDEAALAVVRERLALTDAAPWADELVDEAMVRAPVAPELRDKFFEFLGGEPVPEAEDAAEADASGEDVVVEAGPEEEPALEDAGGDEVEVTPQELAEDLSTRLYQISQDLSVALEAWKDLPRDGRQAILDQVRWISELAPHLEREEEG
jgi:hypothetical protein